MKSLLFPFLLSLCFVNCLQAQVNLTSGLVAYYPFNGNAADVTGNGHAGQLLNGIQFTTDRFGNANSACLFDGFDDYIRIVDNGAFSTTNFSLVLWFQSNSDNLQNLVGKRNFTTTAGSGGAQYQFFINYPPFPGIGSNLVGNNQTCTDVSTSSYINTTDWICRNKWYCAVITFDGVSHKIYIDGVLKKNVPTSFNGFLNCSSDIRLGNWWQGDLLPYNGKMDDIRWYNRAISQAEVTALYDNFPTLSGPCSPNAGIGFLSPDTVCVNTPVTIANTSVGASNYYWNFCVAGSITNPTGANLGGFGLTLPVFMDYAKDGVNYYGFVTNNVPGKLIRLDFGNSLLNTPTVFDLGNLGGAIPSQCEGIQIVKDGGKWYAIVVGGQPIGRIVKVDFGPSLSNNSPVATNWGNVGNLAYPTDLHVFQDAGNWYGLTINAQTNTITRFNFTNSFSNTPSGVNLGNIGSLDYPTGICAVSNNGLWYAFITNAGVASGFNSPTSSLSRLDFGTSLLNTPSGSNLGNPGGVLKSARDVTVYKSCNEIFGLAVNYSTNNDVVKLNFNNNLTAIPTAISLGNLGTLDFPHSVSKLFREGNDLYSFIPSVNANTLSRLKFTGCSTASLASSTSPNPAPISYNAPGTYNINLTIDDGLPTQSSLCKQVVVLNNTQSPVQNKSICNGDSLLLTSTRPSGNVWNTGNATNSIYVKTPGIYWVQSAVGSCTNIDSFVISLKPSPFINIGADTAICTTDSLVLNAGNTGATYLWQGGQTTQTIIVKQAGLYYVAVTNNGCTARDSITVSLLASPVISLSNDTTICRADQTLLTATGGAVYSWSPANSLSGSTGGTVTANPLTTTTYYVTATNSMSCVAKDSVTVIVIPKPIVNIGADTSLCTLDSLVLNAGNTGAAYIWQNNQTTQTIVAQQGGLYYVAVNLNGCTVRDTMLITNLPAPTVVLSKDTTICKLDSIQLKGSGGTNYVWMPGTGLANSQTAVTMASPVTTTKYYLTVTNSANCKARDSVTVTVMPKPVVSLGPDKTLCSIDTLVLDAGNIGATYNWQNGAATQMITVSQGGLYYVTVNRSGCFAKDSITITDLPSPIVTVSPDTTICKTATAVLSASGGNLYTWFPVNGLSTINDSTVAVNPAITTNYYVTVAGTNNCMVKDSIQVTVAPKPQFTVNSSRPVACVGDTVLLIASGGDHYLWSPLSNLAAPDSNITQAFPGSTTLYSVIIVNDACRVTDTLYINLPVADKPHMLLAKSNDINCFQGQATLTASGANTYLWQPASVLSDSTSSHPLTSITKTTLFHVMATTNDGCMIEDSITVNVVKGDDGSGFPVPTAFTPNGDGKNDCFSVQHWGTVTDFSLNIYNRWGELVFHGDEPSQCWNGFYKAVLQPTDVYVYWIKAKTLCGDIFRKGSFALIR